MVVAARWPLYLLIGIGVILGAAIVIGVRWLNSPAFSLVYGIKPIASVQGRQVYLKRAAGAFYDRMALSLNSDRCVGPDAKTDYVLRGENAGAFPVYYVSGETGIVVYDNTLDPPSGAKWSITIEEKSISTEPHFGRREQDYHARGISSVELPVRDLKPCDD